MNGRTARVLRRESESMAYYREAKRTWSRLYHNPRGRFDVPRRSAAEKSEAAKARGQAERLERDKILRQHPSLGTRWMPIQNLRRAARSLES